MSLRSIERARADARYSSDSIWSSGHKSAHVLMNLHRPPHAFSTENSIYFLTAKTVGGERFLARDAHKQLFLSTLATSAAKHAVAVHAFVVHDNHYHLLASFDQPSRLSAFVRDLHANSARLINQKDIAPGRQIWYQYWDRGIRSERDFWYRFNYIHHNPVKHGYCRSPEEVETYPWCSYQAWIEKEGKAWADDVFAKYPIKDFTIEHED